MRNTDNSLRKDNSATWTFGVLGAHLGIQIMWDALLQAGGGYMPVGPVVEAMAYAAAGTVGFFGGKAFGQKVDDCFNLAMHRAATEK